MKRTAFTLDLGKFRRTTENISSMGKMFLLLSTATFFFFLVLGAVGFSQTKLQTSPVSSMKGLAAAVSNEFFIDMLGLEVPHLSEQKEAASTFSQKNVFGFVFRMLTDINPHDPKTLLAREVPGLGIDSSVLLRKTQSTNPNAGPIDYPPSNVGSGGSGGTPDSQPGGTGGVSPTPLPSPTPSAEPTPAAKPTTGGKKVVLIYHSHNRESWVSELGLKAEDANKAHDAEKNITQVGKHLADRLEEKGIGTAHYATDYASSIKDYNWYYSYKYSQKTVKEAFAANSDIQFVFDLHRDDSPREQSVLTVDGKKYAKVFFVIGQKNKAWEKNEAFASQMQEKLEKKMPGISRGIWAKKTHEGNAEYNQSLSPNSVLVEVGSVHNTKDEAMRTAEVLADVIADMYWDAAKVDQSKPLDAKVS